MKLNGEITEQLKTSPGLIKQSLKIQNPFVYWTLTVWENKESMMRFRNSGAHKEAMKQIGSMAHKAKAGNWETNVLPTWKEAMEKIETHATASY